MMDYAVESVWKGAELIFTASGRSDLCNGNGELCIVENARDTRKHGGIFKV